VQVDTYGSLRSPVLMEKDMVYTVFSHIPQYNLDLLREAPRVEPQTIRRIRRTKSDYLQLPDNLPKD
jgi:hypothetical protein